MDTGRIADSVSGISLCSQSGIPIRNLGKSGPFVPMLGLGGQSIFELGTTKDAESVFDTAYESGIRYIDTAHDYGDSQERFGKLIAGIDDLFISTKIGKRDYDGFMRELDENIELLGRKPDTVQIHAISSYEEKTILENGGTLEIANEARSTGAFDYVGVTSHSSPQTLANIVKFGDGIDSALVTVSAGDTRFLSRFIPIALSRGVALIAMKTMGRMRLIRPGGPGVRTAKEALDFAFSCPIDVAVVGFTFPEEVKECVEIVKSFEPMMMGSMRQLIEGTQMYCDEVMFYRDNMNKWGDVPQLRPSLDWYYGMEV